MLTGGMRVVHITYVEVQMRPAPSAPTRRVGRTLAACALIGASGALAACSSGDDSGKPELIWYINPDAGGQDAVAENCSTDDYTIDTRCCRRTPASSGSSWRAGWPPRTRAST